MISATTRVGEIRRAKNGLMMTIVAYRKFADIDIQFEDGYISTHRSYANFLTKFCKKSPTSIGGGMNCKLS